MTRQSAIVTLVEDPEIEGKYCNGPCGEFKSFDEFHKDRTQKDGYKKACKVCRSGIQKRYRTQKTSTGSTEYDRLLSEARSRALRRLVELHQKEFLNLLARYKREVGIDPTWKQLS
jgi:hypothetical protein